MSGPGAPIPQQHGMLILDKPSGPTSAGCLNAIKRELGQRKIGHAGTLDPMARGVLLVLLGQGTKLASFLLEGEKTYSGEIVLGVETDTYDIQGKVIEERSWQDVSEVQVRGEIAAWMGLSEQEVPPFSAAKHQGQPLYALKRAGKEVPEKTKNIRISLAQVIDIDLPRISFRVRCSRGTYIRSLAHSLGIRLGCGAVLSALLREESHPFGLDQAHGLEEVLADPAGFPGRILSLKQALPLWPQIRLNEVQVGMVKNGVRLRVEELGKTAGDEPARALFLDDREEPLALVEAKSDGSGQVWTILRGLWPPDGN
jgi:tRNA pseudouridine55 synthase